MKYYFKLDDMIDNVDVIKEGKYNGFSIILIGGSSYKPEHFNKVDFDIDFYKNFDTEREFPNINFQKTLSKITTTFSFNRPTDLLNHNIYNGDKYDFYIASKIDLTINNYGKFIDNILKYHNIKPPYVFIGMSEGCYDIFAYLKYQTNLIEKNLIKKVFLIDGGYVGKYLDDYEYWRGNKKWWLSIKNNSFPKINKIKPILIKNRKLLEKIDVYNFNVKSYQFLKNYKKLINFNKQIPLYLCYAKYHYNKEGWINYKSSPEEIILLKKNFCKFLKINNYNIKCRWFNAPHQIERVLPITLSKYIHKKVIKYIKK
jgi:hypothetical protein